MALHKRYTVKFVIPRAEGLS